MDATGTAATLAAFAAAHELREEKAVVSTLVDTVGVALAGLETAPVRALRDWLEPSTGEAVAWGLPGRVAPSSAALLNGTAAHALDFDDAGLSMPLHPSAVLWPAVLAVAGPATDPGRVLAAVEAGQIAFRSIADVLPIAEHYDAGWHATGTIGHLAAALSCAVLAELSPEQTAHALGVAASTAAGSLANFGTGTKPLHAGLAARDAVMAVGLARAGMTANPLELDDPRGFLARYGAPQVALDVDLAERLGHWRDHWVADTVPKQFPSCFGTHRAVAAAARLHAEGVHARDVERVRVEAHPATLRPLREGTPQTPDEAKFSMAFTVARALQTGGLGLADFTDAALADEEWRALAGRVDVSGAETPTGRPELAGERFARVSVTLRDGSVQERVVTFASADDRASYAEVEEKFLRCVTATGRTAWQAAQLLEAIRAGVAGPHLGQLTDALEGEERP